MRKHPILCLLVVISVSCVKTDAVKSDTAISTPSSSASLSPTPLTKIPLDQIDLTKIGSIGGKGRAQDRDYHDNLPIVDQLLAHGKEAIPFLISKLDDETKINYQIVDFWYQAYVGDVAFILLTDFFLDDDEEMSTIKGMDWDTFLERGNNRDIMGEEVFRRYIKKHGRKKIKQRWQDVWEKNKDRIYWDEEKNNFRLEEK